jgi:hypothetical protein
MAFPPQRGFSERLPSPFSRTDFKIAKPSLCVDRGIHELRPPKKGALGIGVEAALNFVGRGAL